jgi:hypothetical protein
MKTRPLPALTEKDITRFWSKVDRSGGPEACWPWLAARMKDGRGIFHIGDSAIVLAPRVAFRLEFDSDPGQFGVCHHCDTPPCCNPAHLFLGTQADNTRDMREKGRGTQPPRNVFRGERQWNAKLTAAQVVEMRAQRQSQGVTFKELGQRFGVHAMTARRAVRGVNWRHVGGAA